MLICLPWHLLELYWQPYSRYASLSFIHLDGFYRGDKLINLKVLADDALQKCRDRWATHTHTKSFVKTLIDTMHCSASDFLNQRHYLHLSMGHNSGCSEIKYNTYFGVNKLWLFWCLKFPSNCVISSVKTDQLIGLVVKCHSSDWRSLAGSKLY